MFLVGRQILKTHSNSAPDVERIAMWWTIRLYDDFDTTWAAKLQGDNKWHIGRNMLPEEAVLRTCLEAEHQNSYLESRIGLLLMVVPQSY
jgi:hypothetical protein